MQDTYTKWEVMKMLRPIVDAMDDIQDYLSLRFTKEYSEMILIELIANLENIIRNVGETERVNA